MQITQNACKFLALFNKYQLDQKVNSSLQKIKMSKKQMCLIYYHVPEDFDDPETPNVFGVMVSKNNIRLQHLYDHFPLKGSYIFRFKVMYDTSIAWLDLPELDSKLPTFKDKIMIKATRVSWETNTENPYGHYRFKNNSNQSQTQKAAQTTATKTTKQPTPKATKQENLIDAPQKQPKKAEKVENLLDEHHEESNKSSKKNQFGDLDNLGGYDDLI